MIFFASKCVESVKLSLEMERKFGTATYILWKTSKQFFCEKRRDLSC